MMTRRILLLEDHDDTREAMARLLRNRGHEVVVCAGTEDAVQHVEGCGADVAILDVRLPGRSGDDFGRELRQRCPFIRIVFLTGESDLERLKRCVPDCHVVRKPVDLAVLEKLIECD